MKRGRYHQCVPEIRIVSSSLGAEKQPNEESRYIYKISSAASATAKTHTFVPKVVSANVMGGAFAAVFTGP